MRRVFITVHLKNVILLITAFIVFIVIASVLIVGVGNNVSISKSKNSEIKSQDNNNIIKYSELPKTTKVKVYITKENAVKELNLEEYVTGVVAAEMPAAFAVEALKAQAVAARTYALAHVIEDGGTPCKNGRGADLCDTVHCQVYMSKTERVQAWNIDNKNKGEQLWNKISKAVKDTSGEVLTYNNELVMEPYYFSTSSGKTENSEEVFSTSIPYLRSVESPGEETVRNAKSIKIVKYKELSLAINNNYNNSKVTSTNIKNQIKILDRTEGGSVKNIKVGNITMTGSKFRTMLGLKSSNFEIKFNTTSMEIDCSGYGHGVGMSQFGADAMGKAGKNYNQILTHYYQGTVISK
ncbi:stage II sporulation protein D [Clostridium lacusfryxellense]|uniref:stage II sporulation protein D n=1 Tax=Clostridium lacusfryxellense TaxID=205328 RepID=UPI001C0AE18F|nr:stage II sporulation protein D [Clostridium lacusfryxellense]MBU3111523.1 stage II sporulation protein D [Clostridium lacusfryxellense]